MHIHDTYDCIFAMLMVILFLKFKHMNHRAVTLPHCDRIGLLFI